MIPPTIPPTMTDVIPLETESSSATRVSCVDAVDVLGVSGVVAVESFSVLMCVVVSEDLVIGVSGIIVVDESDGDDDVMLACVLVTAGDPVMLQLGTVIVVSVLARHCVTVAVARDVTEAQLQSVVIGSSGIACVVTVVAGVDGRVVETSGHESAFSSVHINNIIVNYKLLTKLLSSEQSCDTVKAQTRLT